MARSLDYYKKALSSSDSTGSPQIEGHQALCNISVNMLSSGNFQGAQEHAQKAKEYATCLGDLFAQALSLRLQGKFRMIAADYRGAQLLFREAGNLIECSGLRGGTLDRNLKSCEAEIHISKTEYQEARELETAITSMCRPTSYDYILAHLNIVLIDIATGIDSLVVHKNLENCKLHIRGLYGFQQEDLTTVADIALATQYTRDGNWQSAKIIFTGCLTDLLGKRMELKLLCLEQLADVSTGMNDTTTTLGWAVIFLRLALQSKDNLVIMSAIRRLGQIFIAQKDDKTALALFTVALDGFTFIDVHRWRADCMVRIADIWERRGDVARAVVLWRAARPLFERSSQVKDVTRIDGKLSMIDMNIFDGYDTQVVRLM